MLGQEGEQQEENSLACVVQLAGVLSGRQKGLGFDSQSGTCPGCGFHPGLRHVQEGNQ